jgi:hypothetical protein
MSTQKQNAFEPAFPDPLRGGQAFDPYMLPSGLSKIELFAAMAMQGILSANTLHGFYGKGMFEAIAADSVKVANALLIELEK